MCFHYHNFSASNVPNVVWLLGFATDPLGDFVSAPNPLFWPGVGNNGREGREAAQFSKVSAFMMSMSNER